MHNLWRVHLSYQNAMFLVILLLILPVLIKPLYKKLILETIRPLKLNQKLIVMTQVHQMINILILIEKWPHWKETFKSAYLPVDFFYSMTLSSNVKKIVREKKLNVKLNLIMYVKQMTQTLKLKLLINFPCLLMNFLVFQKILLKIYFMRMLSIFH